MLGLGYLFTNLRGDVRGEARIFRGGFSWSGEKGVDHLRKPRNTFMPFLEHIVQTNKMLDKSVKI